MSTAIRIPDKLAKEAKAHSQFQDRSLASQIAYWAKIGKIAEENTDLSLIIFNFQFLNLVQYPISQFSIFKLLEVI